MIEGKLYSCSGYFLLLYPDKETATAATSPALAATATATTAAAVAADAGTIASYWSKQFDKPVNYCDPKTPLLVLSVKEEYIQVLAGDQKGWIIYRDWLDIGEIIDAAA